MRKSFLLFCVFAIISLGLVFFKPLGAFIFKIKEPFFISPIGLSDADKISIRSDGRGNGAFGAERRNGRLHEGLDIQAHMGSEVFASKSGFVITKIIPKGYGNLIIINHPDGWQTRYGHLSKFAVPSNSWVEQGRIIGYVGKTGNAGGRYVLPHLHFEIRDPRGRPVDPLKYIDEGGAMKKTVFAMLIILASVYLVGCGETVSGVGKDITRIGKGIKTIFIRQE